MIFRYVRFDLFIIVKKQLCNLEVHKIFDYAAGNYSVYFVFAHSLSVWTVFCHGSKRVCHCHCSCPDEKFLGVAMERIPAPILFFRMISRSLGYLLKAADCFNHIISIVGVASHYLKFLFCQLPWFFQNAVRNKHLADIMQITGNFHQLEFNLCQEEDFDIISAQDATPMDFIV